MTAHYPPGCTQRDHDDAWGDGPTREELRAGREEYLMDLGGERGMERLPRIELQLEIERHLERIEKLLGENYVLTLIARHKTMPPDKNADILVSMDEPEKARAVIDRNSKLEPIT